MWIFEGHVHARDISSRDESELEEKSVVKQRFTDLRVAKQ